MLPKFDFVLILVLVLLLVLDKRLNFYKKTINNIMVTGRSVYFDLRSLIIAVGGSIILLAIYRAVKR